MHKKKQAAYSQEASGYVTGWRDVSLDEEIPTALNGMMRVL
jgi:hypothetical protein